MDPHAHTLGVPQIIRLVCLASFARLLFECLGLQFKRSTHGGVQRAKRIGSPELPKIRALLGITPSETSCKR